MDEPNKSWLFADHQPVLVRFLLLFCRRLVEPRDCGWYFVFKILRGQRYLVDLYHAGDRKARRPIARAR